MNNDTDIQLSGPFKVTDGSGKAHDVKGVRIFDEGYGVIDVYVDFAAPLGNPRLYKDTALHTQVVARLRQLGYKGPDFGHGDPALQGGRLIVMEAPEEFNAFAASKGWKDLAAEFGDDGGDWDEPAVPAPSSRPAATLSPKPAPKPSPKPAAQPGAKPAAAGKSAAGGGQGGAISNAKLEALMGKFKGK